MKAKEYLFVDIGDKRGMRFYFMDGADETEKIRAWERGIIGRLGFVGRLEILGDGKYKVHGMRYVLDKVYEKLGEFREFFPDATMRIES